MTLMQEREVVRDMTKLSKIVSEIDGYMNSRSRLDALEANRSHIMGIIRKKETILMELQGGINRVHLAHKIGLSVTELTEVEFLIGAEHVAFLCGKYVCHRRVAARNIPLKL